MGEPSTDPRPHAGPSARPGSADFERDVHAVARLVPPGRVTSYGAIARYLGAARASRMVGWAMNRALAVPSVPEADVDGHPSIPAHRVVNRQGLLTGRLHFPTPTAMAERLREEGVPVEGDRVVDFAAHFWDPNTEL